MTWKDWHSFVHKELRRFYYARPEFVFPIPRDYMLFEIHVSNLNMSTNEQIDGAIRKYVTSGRWPRLPKECRYLVRHRLLFAEETIELLMTPYFDMLSPGLTTKTVIAEPVELSRAEMIEWLLIVIWMRHGTLYLLRVAEDDYRQAIYRQTAHLEKSDEAFAS
jgi:hypothetical protein